MNSNRYISIRRLRLMRSDRAVDVVEFALDHPKEVHRGTYKNMARIAMCSGPRGFGMRNARQRRERRRFFNSIGR